MTKRKLPIGIQTFRTIREEGWYYVDKTAYAALQPFEVLARHRTRSQRLDLLDLLDLLDQSRKDSVSSLWRGLLAGCWHECQNAFMSVQITIRGVPEDVRDELAARAALRRQSMQEFLRGELERIATRPSRDAWLQAVRDRKAAAGSRVRPSSILRARDADRT